MTTTDYATGEWVMLFESDGEGDRFWTIEQDPQGYLCVTSNAETRRRVEADQYRGWNADELRSGLEGDRVPAEIITRYLEQAGF